MPPILKSDLKKKIQTKATVGTSAVDFDKAAPIREETRFGQSVYNVYSISGKLLVSSTNAEKCRAMRDALAPSLIMS